MATRKMSLMTHCRLFVSATGFVRLLAVIAVVSLAVASGCAGDPAGTNDDDVVTLTPEERVSALDDIVDVANALTAPTVDGRRQELIDYLRSRPEIEDAGADIDGSVWAIFTDGRPLTIVANQELDADPAALNKRLSVLPSAGPDEVPRGLNARVLLGGWKDTGHAVNKELEDMLAKRNYTIVSGDGIATVDALKGVQGDAVFYFRGHGGFLHFKDGTSEYSLVTATKVSLLSEIRYKADLDSHRLGYTASVPMNYLPALILKGAHYAMGTKFVEKYLSFEKDSFVWISACFSFGGSAGFRRAFHNKGAGVYFGWTGSFKDGVDNNASQYAFDRLLGLNEYLPEAIKQRPFDYVSVKKDLAREGYDFDRAPTGGIPPVLTYEPGPNGPSGLLAPSIQYMDVNEQNGTLILTGQFGSEEPDVEINGSPMSLRTWGPKQIVADLEDSGPRSAGYVVVKSRGRQSNTRVLTQWRPVFNIQFLEGSGSPPLKWEGPIKLHFRADIASYRDESGEDPKYRMVPFHAARDSDGDITASGSRPSGGTTTTWFGTSHVVNMLLSPSAANVLGMQGEVDTENAQMNMFFFVSVTNGMWIRNTPPGPPSDVAIPYVWAYGEVFLSNPPLPAMRLNIDDDFNILSDQRRAVPLPDPSAVLFWATADAKFFRPDTAGR
jgi:hypothetical protein